MPEVPCLQQQQTIAGPVLIAGQALHSGVYVNLRLSPLPPDSGVLLSRTDLQCEPIKACPEFVQDTKRCMAMGNETWRIQTVEHLMAALHGLGVDNVLVEVDAEEIPVADGSAREFVNAIRNVGLVKQESPRRVRKLREPVWVQSDSDPRAYLVALPGEGLRVTYTFTSDHPTTGNQVFQYVHTPDNFSREIAAARTIAFEKEVELLQKQGLGLGGSLDTVVLVGDDGYKNDLRYPDEIVRHKILDIMGDLYLVGPFEAQIIAVRSGHRLDLELAQKLQMVLCEAD